MGGNGRTARSSQAFVQRTRRDVVGVVDRPARYQDVCTEHGSTTCGIVPEADAEDNGQSRRMRGVAGEVGEIQLHPPDTTLLVDQPRWPQGQQ